MEDRLEGWIDKGLCLALILLVCGVIFLARALHDGLRK